MLVQNFFQVTSKSPDEIRSELAPDIRAMKIDPDGREKERSNSENRNLPGRKRDKDLNLSSDLDSLENSTSDTNPYDVYNSKGKVVRLKISG